MLGFKYQVWGLTKDHHFDQQIINNSQQQQEGFNVIYCNNI